MTPSIAIVRIQSPHWRGFRLWVPLFLLWIPLILLAPLILLVILAACLAGQINPWSAIATFWSLLTSLSGTDVRVAANGSHVTVRIL
jgi:hypothetical protein